jgi:hypothetical protein
MRYILIALLLLTATSCIDTKSIRDVPKEVVDKVIENAVEEKIRTPVATKDGESKLDALKREREEVIGKLAAMKASYDARIDAARVEIVKVKCYWIAIVSGILGGLLVIGCVILRNIPGLRSILGWSAVVFLSITFLALGVSWLVDYLKYAIMIGVGLLFLIVVPNVSKLFRALSGVVKGFEELKPSIPKYKDVMRQYVDKESNKVINTIRGVKE